LKKLVVRALGPALLGLVFASAAFADSIGSITLSSDYPGGYLWYPFTSTSALTPGPTGQIVTTNTAPYNEPVAPYTSTITIGGNTVPAFLICMDINNPTGVGTTYPGTFYTAEGISGVSGQEPFTINEEVSWLADKMAGVSPNIPANESITGPISMAIWQLEFPTSTDSDKADADLGNDPIDPAVQAQNWINLAQAAVAKPGYHPDSTFFIPDDPGIQRFVAISETPTPGTLDLLPAPEPGTLGLMGAGLLGLAGILRRKLRR
jgi:hypothetical protein